MKKAKRTFVIDWRIEGSVSIEAKSAEEAQKLFDKEFASGLPRFVHEGEVSNDEPAEQE